MIFKKEQMYSFLEAAKPLIKWLNDNAHPHVEATVTSANAELKECCGQVTTHEFVKD